MPKRNPMPGEMDIPETLDQSTHMDLFKLKTQLITIPMPLPSTLLVTHSRKDKINTTPESYGEMNPKSNLMPGEPFHGLQPKKILD
jgi:hypothetical protein